MRIRSVGQALLKACAQGSLSSVKTYAPQLYNTTSIDRTITPPLKLAIATAAENGHADILRYFFTNIPQCRDSTCGPWNPQTNLQGRDELPEKWRSALLPDLVILRAILGSKPAAFQTLMDFGLDIHYPLEKIGTPITLAVQRQNVEMVRFLLSKGANANDQYWIPNDTVLARAASLSSREIVVLLLEHGANLQGSKALKSAAESGRIDIATLLLDRGANIDEIFRHNLWDDDISQDTIGTALHVAIEYGQDDTVQFLLDRGARIDLMDGDGNTPLRLSEALGNSKVSEMLNQVKI